MSSVTPPCPHFTHCGGCQLQHLETADYLAGKTQNLARVVSSLGVAASVIQHIVSVGPKSRRRAELKIAMEKSQPRIGFFAAKTHQIVDIHSCPVSEDALMDAVEWLRHILVKLKKPGYLKAAQVTCLEQGMDMLLISQKPLPPRDQSLLAEAAGAINILRLALHCNETQLLYEKAPVTIRFGDIPVALPIGAFLQATATGQDILTSHVTQALSHCHRVADLFSGCGTYSFPLANSANQVSAWEGEETMVHAMHDAITTHGLKAKIQASIRDLFTTPLSSEELQYFDGLVINPPRAGAQAQSKAIAQSQVETVVTVSCNPNTWKKDASILIAQGYQLTSVLPVDQFYWSKHLELVAVFKK